MSEAIATLDEVLRIPGLFRDGEESKERKGVSLFTFRKGSEGERVSTGREKRAGLFTFRGKHAKSSSMGNPALGPDSSRESSSESVPSGPQLVERLLGEHKKPVCRMIEVPATPPEVLSLDESGVVYRWPLQQPDKGSRVSLGHFSCGGGAVVARDMAVCGKSIWISVDECAEIRDASGRLMWKLPKKAFAFAAHSSLVDRMWVGCVDGQVELYKKEDLSMTVQLNFRPPVSLLSVAKNAKSSASELWVLQGRVISILDEASGKLIEELPSSVESNVNAVRANAGGLWMACEDGKILRWDVSSRSIIHSFQAMETPCRSLAITPTRVWASGLGRGVRVFDIESGAPVESVLNAHEEGGIGAICLVSTVPETHPKARLWTGGNDLSIAVWSLENTMRKRSLLPAAGRDDSDDFEDSTSASIDSMGLSSKSPRMYGTPPRVHLSLSSSNTHSRDASSAPSITSQEDDDDDDDDEADVDSTQISGSQTSGSRRRKGKKRVLSKLVVAAMGGNLDKMQAVMDAFEAKEYADDESKQAALRKLLDARGPGRRTALHMAAQGGHVECVKLLLEWGSDVTLTDKHDMYPVNLVTATEVKMILIAKHDELGVDPKLGRKSSSSSTASTKSRGHGRSKSVAVSSGSSAMSSSSSSVQGTRRIVRKKSSGKAAVPSGNHLPRGSRAGIASPTESPQRSPRSPRSPRISLQLDKKTRPSVGDGQELREDNVVAINSGAVENKSPRSRSQRAASAASTVSDERASTPEETQAAVRIQALLRMNSARLEAKQLRLQRDKRKNIGEEMLKTEETYVRTLDVLVNKIRVTMSTQSFRESVECNVTEQDMKAIFPSSLTMLLSAHVTWLAQLQSRINDWTANQCVGDLFLQLSPYLKMYIVYVSNFEQSTLKIRELKKREKSKFTERVQEVFVNLGDPTNDLASMLVTPVQRIPRYVMMLKDLLKHTSTQHPDYGNLLKAVKIMTDTTVLVDRKAEDAKNAQKVLEVADSILEPPASIVQPNRKWVKDGPVGLIVTATDVRPRYAYLFTDVLLLCIAADLKPGKHAKKDDKPALAPSAGGQYRYQRELSLQSASVHSLDDSEGMENVFVVRSPKIAFALQAQSAADKAAWMKGIVSVIETRTAGNLSRQRPEAGNRNSGMLTRMRTESDMLEAINNPGLAASPPSQHGRKLSLTASESESSK